MKSVCMFFVAFASLAGNLAVEPKLQFEAPPQDLDFFLQNPSSIDIDAQGNFYILDFGASVIFVWNEDGSFSHVIGKPGEGPGELSFNGRGGGPQGYVGVNDGKVYVYNGGKRNLEVFSLKGDYQKSIALDIRGGRTGSFFVTPNNEFLIYQQSFMRETPAREVLKFSSDGKESKVLASIEDHSFKREGTGGGRPTAVVINAYSPTLFMTYNAVLNRLVTADTGKPEFKFRSLENENAQSVKLALVQRDISDFDRNEFDELPFIKNSNFLKATYGEKFPFFTGILSYGENFLVYEESPLTHRVSGYLVNKSGTMLGHVKMTLGQGGGLMGMRGRLVGVFVDDEGELSIRELTVGSES